MNENKKAISLRTSTYNKLFDQINALTWYPWMGSNYTENKLLIVGESHYAQDEDGNFDQACYDDFVSDKNTTINIVERLLNGESWKMFQNTYKALLGTDDINKEAFWSNIAFFNLIQRPMKTIEDRPSKDDCLCGWDVFYEVLKVIKPTHCIILGTQHSKYLYPVMNKKEGVIFEDGKSTIEQWDKKIGRCWGKVAHLEYEDINTDITFIQHPSRAFNDKDWHDYLMEKMGVTLENLKSKTKAE